MSLDKFIFSYIFHFNFSEESDDYDSDETIQPDIHYYIDDFSDDDGYFPNAQDSGQHEVEQDAQIVDIVSR